MSTIITLTTDFGLGSPYVGEMKGAILSINADATIIDLSHDIPPQNIRAGALALAQATRQFPPGSIHVAVVDPGVGTDRAILYAEIAQRHYIGPDNGLLSRLARAETPSKIRAIRNPEYWREEVSTTFHGRDIMAPVAAHVGLGVAPESLGPEVQQIVELEWEEATKVAGKIEGKVESVDSFGNLITNITTEQLADVPRDESVETDCDGHQTQGIFATYDEQPPMTLVAVIGSSGALELAIVGDSAKIMLGADVGAPVTVSW